MKVLAWDSGVGGLTAIAPLLKTYSNLDVTYFGDVANFPYGTKSAEHVRRLTEKNLRWLLGTYAPASVGRFDLAIIACNTASAHGLEIGRQVGEKYQVPVVGVVEPGCQAAMLSTAKRIVVLATTAAVASRSYVKQLEALGCQSEILQKACPLFAPLVEDHLYSGPAVEWIARHYLDSILRPGDVVILGCTHYPFLAPTLSRLYPEIRLIDAGAALMSDPTVQKTLAKASANQKSSLTCLFTDTTTGEERVRSFLNELGLKELSCQYSVIPPFFIHEES